MEYEYLATAGVVDQDEVEINVKRIIFVDATLEWNSRPTFPTITRATREYDRQVK